MNAREKNLVALALAVTVAAGGGYWYFNRANAAGETKKDAAVEVKRLPPSRIRLNMMEGEDGGDQGVNLFGYRKPPLVAAEPPPPPPVVQPIPVAQPRPPQPTAVARPAGPVEAPVTDVPLKYSGFARDDDGKMIAFLETNGTGAPQGHYNLREDDFLLGRFRISKITETSVEVEDLERAETSARRKTPLNLSK